MRLIYGNILKFQDKHIVKNLCDNIHCLFQSFQRYTKKR